MDMGKAKMLIDGKNFRVIQCNCWSSDERIQECDVSGIDVQVLSTVPVMFAYSAKPQHTLELARYLNDHIAQVCDKNPKRFIGLATLPMQSPDLAIQELKRCINELGLFGVQIGSHINDWNLDAPELNPFWKACEELNVAVFVHPWGMQTNGRMEKYWYPWLIGMPCETTVAMCSVIFGGVLERHPKLKISFAHGGGSFPGTLGRIVHGFNVRPDLFHDEDTLQFIIKKFGIDKVMLGSDYPFPLGEHHPGQMIEQSEWLSDEDKEKLLTEYKKAQEEWVTGHTGGSMLEINSVVGVILTSYMLWAATIKYSNMFNKNGKIINLVLEFIILILPNILACTLLSNHTFLLNLFLISISTGLIYTSSSSNSPNSPVDKKKKRRKWDKDSDDDANLEELLIKEKLDNVDEKENYSKLNRKPFLSAYRSSMIILTCIAILAVDFPVFPRRFAKVETFGTSLVKFLYISFFRSFVFSSGIVSARPFLKRPENRFKPFKGQLFQSVKQSLPILLLGFIRLIMVKAEYGKHWNFFFTLGLLPIFVTICRAIQKYVRFSIVGLGIAILYQIALSFYGLQDYIHDSPRTTNLISANKEGIFSFWGYLTIFLFALDIGHYILPLDPYYTIRSALELGFFSNYWKKKNVKEEDEKRVVPIIMDAINFNGLATLLWSKGLRFKL
ncbi:4274_t:CDS:10 [Diversispora eburnea]|uniref:2-amino-3-carboxymuconate-6-semialdehyde decarboxylase n=1 Tax=Diversispora eburnea TaxID=1213867 RepID=A0A9N8ZT64_9GLOM|nr:4274_t:CDS:10 [Diversispora eburnea]